MGAFSSLDFVLGRGDGSPLKLSLTEAGINNITCLLSLTVDEVEDLEYLKTGADPDDEYSRTPVIKGDRKLLIAFLAYDDHLHESGIPEINYKALTQSEFDELRISPNYKRYLRPTNGTIYP